MNVYVGSFPRCSILRLLGLIVKSVSGICILQRLMKAGPSCSQLACWSPCTLTISDTWMPRVLQACGSASEALVEKPVTYTTQRIHSSWMCKETGMASNGRIRTEQPQLYFYGEADQVLDPSQVSIDNISSLFYFPMGSSFAEMSGMESTDRAGSYGGLKCCLLPVDTLIASLCLASCWQKQLVGSCGSETLLYSTHGLSSVGRSLPLPQRVPSNRGRGRATGSRGRMADTAPSLKLSNSRQWQPPFLWLSKSQCQRHNSEAW